MSSRPSTPLHRRAARFLRREGWVLFIGFLALATRLVWNTIIHPPRNFVYSDMHGYFDRADDVVRQPLTAAYDYLAFYPWGTHAYLGLVKLLFTTPQTCPRSIKDGVAAAGCAPMDVAMALLGAIGVIYTTLVARRLTQHTANPATGRRRWVYVVIGLAAVFYYPFLAQNGFYLSETPFFACLAASTFYSLRLADEGKTRDAILFGIVTGVGAWVRPQILMSVALLALFWLFRRRQFPALGLRKLAIACVPLALLLVLSAVRTTRHARTDNKDEFALVSTNDALNWAFGRCHTIGIEARTKQGYRSGFGPPSLGGLWFGARDLRRKKQPVFLELYPALPDDLNCDVNKKHREKKEPTEPCIQIEGKMWSRDVLRSVASRCVEKTGLAKQGYYALTHVALNFGFNWMWPDYGSGNRKARVLGINVPYGGETIKSWQIGFGASVVPFALLACLLAFRKRRARDGLLAMHFWAATIVAIMYFGETRFRTPYDFLFLILGFDLMARIARWIGRKLRAVTPW